MFKDLTLSEIYNKEVPFESLVPGTGILLIGEASIGPSMIPVKTKTVQDASMTFGVESELANAYMEAKLSGASDIYLLRINGTHAETNVQNAFKLCSLEAIDSANYLKYEVITSNGNRYLTLFNQLTGYNTSYYLSGKTISQIVSEINIDSMTFQSPVYAAITTEGSTDILVDEYFSDAQTDGASIQYGTVSTTRIGQILEEIETYPIGQVGILCKSFYSFDDKGDYFYTMLAKFADTKRRACSPCIITVGIDDSLVAPNAVYDISVRFKNNIIIECPVSEFINVVISKPTYPMLHPGYMSNGVASYCGLIDSLAYYEGTTNKVIYGAESDIIALSVNQKSDLANFGYVVFTSNKSKEEQQVRVLKGLNLSRGFSKVIDLNNTNEYIRNIPSPMSNIANVKLVKHIVYELYSSLQLEELSNISTLKYRITEVLDAEIEYIKDYKIDITESYQGFAKTYIVGVEITPIGELNSMTLTIQTQ